MFMLLTISLLFPILTPHTQKSQPERAGGGMKKLLLVLMMWPVLAQATCIMIFRTKNKITIGADSRRREYNKEGKFTGLRDGYCKIRQAGKFHYALVGDDDIAQIDLLNKIGRRAKNMKEFKLYAWKNLRAHYIERLEFIRSRDWNEYASMYLTENRIIAEIPFFRFEKGIMQINVVRFFNTTKGNGPIDVQVSESLNSNFYVLGVYSDIENKYNYKVNLDKEVKSKGEETVIRENIKWVSGKYSQAVGGDIYVLELKANKRKWLGKKPNC